MKERGLGVKRLTVHCPCGKTKVVYGEDACEIIVKLDASGWVDCSHAADSGKRGIFAWCPDCVDAMEAEGGECE